MFHAHWSGEFGKSILKFEQAAQFWLSIFLAREEVWYFCKISWEYRQYQYFSIGAGTVDLLSENTKRDFVLPCIDLTKRKFIESFWKLEKCPALN